MTSQVVAGLLALALAGCSVAPQSPGWRRDMYIGMTTANGALGGMMAGGLVGAVPCLLALSHRCPRPYSTIAGATALAGAILGGYFAHDASSEATMAPNQNEWILTSAPTALFATAIVIGGVVGLVQTTRSTFASTGPRDRIVGTWVVTFSSSDEARRAIDVIGEDCAMLDRDFDARFGSAPRSGPSDTHEGALCDPMPGSDGTWRVALKVVTKL